MEPQTYQKIVAILRVLDAAGRPMGSTRLARELSKQGIELSNRMIRYYLEITDGESLTHSLGKRGREITLRGKMELRIALAVEKVGFTAARVDELAYNMTFDINKMKGNVILNVSLIDESNLPTAAREMYETFASGFAMGRYVAVAGPGERLGAMDVPHGQYAIGTVCSITVNGVLLKSGIVTHSRFGGLLEIRDGQPSRFTQIINYDGTTIDPLEIFIRGQMTHVRPAINTGRGIIGASFREIPTASLQEVEQISHNLEQTGLGAILLLGRPNQSLLGVPVSYGRTGMILVAGLNPLAAVEESGVRTTNWAMKTMIEFDRLTSFESLIQLTG